MNLPIYLPNLAQKDNENQLIIAADVGGTKTNIAVFCVKNQKLQLWVEATYVSTHYQSFNAVLRDFISKSGAEKAQRICIGVAGPVMNAVCKLTNLDWVMSANEIKKEFGFEEVSLINDLEATAYGLHDIDDAFVASLHQGIANEKENMAIIAPGTGLGEAGLYFDGKHLRPFATEGGHTEFSPRSALEIDLLCYLQQKESYICWESLLSGSGLCSIYLFLKEVNKYQEPRWLSQRFEQEDPSAVIHHVASIGLSEVCVLAMKLFVELLAREASHLVLKLKATAGLFLGGGIAPKIFNFLDNSKFHSHFIQNQKMENLLKNVPIKVILNSKTALYGAAYFSAFGEKTT